MGVSVTGERHWIRPRTVPILIAGLLALLTVLFYTFGPPLVPGMQGAAADKCNKLNGSNYRSYKLVWEYPTYPSWTKPHWECFDLRDPGALPVNFGWWVDPF